MKCMGLDPKKFDQNDTYLCEICKPRPLKWTKKQAQEIQVCCHLRIPCERSTWNTALSPEFSVEAAEGRFTRKGTEDGGETKEKRGTKAC